MDPAVVYSERSQPLALATNNFLSRTQDITPATLPSRAVSASLLSQTSHVGGTSARARVHREPDTAVSAVSEEAATQAASDGKQLAESEARDAMPEAVRTREYLYDSAAAFAGSDPYATIDDIRKAAANSEAASEKALHAQEVAAQIFKEVNQSN